MDPRRRFFLRGDPRALKDEAPPVAPRPPWALRPDAQFTERCTRCGDCIAACPRQVLVAGDGGFPELALHVQGCSLCGDCVRACRPGALQADALAPADAFVERIRVNAACLARRGVECRLCGDACDTRALRFVPQRGGIAQLQVMLEACTGCGECLPLCPTQALERHRTTA